MGQRQSTATTDYDLYRARLKELHRDLGIRSLLIANGEKMEDIRWTATQLGEVMLGVEGPNEPNHNRNHWTNLQWGGNTTWLGSAMAYQKDLWNTIKSDETTRHLPVGNFSLSANRAVTSENIPNQEATCDFGAFHYYSVGGGSSLQSRKSVEAFFPSVAHMRKMVPTKPLWTTEHGFSTMAGVCRHRNKDGKYDAWAFGHSQHAGNRYIPREMLEMWNNGFQKMFAYELIDQSNDACKTEHNFGILHRNGTLKGSAVTLKNMIAVLEEPNARFTPDSLAYTMTSSMPTGDDKNPETDEIHHTLLQKSDGRFYLILWQETDSYDPAKKQDIEVSPVNVTLNLTTPMQSARTYLPLISATPTVAQVVNNRLTLAVPDHPLIIELTPVARKEPRRGAVPPATHGLQAQYFKGHDFNVPVAACPEARVDFSWNIQAPLPQLGDEFSVRWTGAITPRVSGLTTFELRGTHVWRLWVNDVLLLDSWAQKDYNAKWKANGRWDRQHEAVLPLQAGVSYPIRLEYAKKEQGQPTPARLQLRWRVGGSPSQVVPVSALKPQRAASKPQLARSAREFYKSIGLNFHKGDSLPLATYEAHKAKLDELGLYTVRLRLHPSDTRDETRRRFLDLYQTLGIKSCALVRERFDTDDPQKTMAAILDDAKAVLPSLLMVEGPNEVDRGPEHFNYGGHGLAHGADTVLGEGWPRGVTLFMQDLHATLRSDPMTARLPIANASLSGGPWNNPGPAHRWAESAAKNSVDVEKLVDFGNYHKYFTPYPDHPAHQDEISTYLRPITPTRPYVITETGFNTGKEAHDQVSEAAQARYVLRNYLVTFNAGCQYTYGFTLADGTIQEGVKFGLLHRDLSPKPSFTALKNLIALVKEPESAGTPVAPRALDYDLQGDSSDVRQTLLQKQNGNFTLLVWREVESTGTVPDRAMTLHVRGSFQEARVYKPLDGSGFAADRTPNTVALTVGDHPTVVELIPAPSAAR